MKFIPQYVLNLVALLLLPLIAIETTQAATSLENDLVKHKQQTHYRVSPDGSKIALLAPHNGAMNIWLQNVGRGQRSLVTRENRSITNFFWQYDNQHLLYLQDEGGDQQYHLYQVDENGFNTRDLTPYKGIQARVVSMLPLVPDQILVSMNLNNRQRHDVFRIHLDSGAIETDVVNPGYVLQWAADADLQTRAGVSLSKNGGYEIIIKDLTNEKWEPKVAIPSGRAIPNLIGFSPDGAVLWYLGDDKTGNIKQWALNLQTGEVVSTPDNASGDVVDVLLDPVLGVPEGIALRSPRKSWRMFHGGYETIMQFLMFEKGDLSFPSRGLQKKQWIVRYSDPQFSTTYQVFILGERHKVVLLGMERPNLRDRKFSATQPLLIPGMNGRKIRATLNRPILKKEGPVPLMIRVGDGSTDQPTFEFDEEAQWLAYKEIATLTLYPPKGLPTKETWMGIADGYWATELQNDVLQVRQWAIEKGHTKSDQIAVKGVGFGGYAALSAALQQPDAFRGVILVNAVTDVPSFMKELPVYHRSLTSKLASWFTGGGSGENPWSGASPLTLLDKIETPVMVIQGANNPWIRPNQTDRLTQKLEALQKPVETVKLDGEGHRFVEEKSNRLYFESLEGFLGQILKEPTH